MIYTALGDSITYGEGASCPARAYPHLIVSAVNKGRSGTGCVRGMVLAHPSWDSCALLRVMRLEGPALFRQSKVVSVWIGGMDLVEAALAAYRTGRSRIAQAVSAFETHLGGILAFIKRTSDARIVCCTQYNPFPASPIAVAGIGSLNRAIGEAAARHGAVVAPAHAWFEGRQAELIRGYKTGRLEDALHGGSLPIHPNDRGHRVIASGLLPHLLQCRPS